MLWERTPDERTGATRGNRCIFCVRGFDGMIKRSRVPPVKQDEYEAHLAGNIAALKAHQVMVANIILQYIKGGGIAFVKLNFKGMQAVTLKVTNARKMITDRPGWDHWEKKLYEAEFGQLATNGKLLEGHRSWELHGVEGVLVPQNK